MTYACSRCEIYCSIEIATLPVFILFHFLSRVPGQKLQGSVPRKRASQVEDLFIFVLPLCTLRCTSRADLFRSDLEGPGDRPRSAHTEMLLQLVWLRDVISSIFLGGVNASDLPRQYSCNLIAQAQRFSHCSSLSWCRFVPWSCRGCPAELWDRLTWRGWPFVFLLASILSAHFFSNL